MVHWWWYQDDDIIFTGQLWMNFVSCSVTIVNKDIWSDDILNWPFQCLLYSMVIQVPFKCFQVFTIEFVKWRHGEVTTKLYCVALCRILFSKCLSTAMWSHFPQSTILKTNLSTLFLPWLFMILFSLNKNDKLFSI